jgi:hypothetical protein
MAFFEAGAAYRSFQTTRKGGSRALGNRSDASEPCHYDTR